MADFTHVALDAGTGPGGTDGDTTRDAATKLNNDSAQLFASMAFDSTTDVARAINGIKIGGNAAVNLIDEYIDSQTWTPGIEAQTTPITSFTASTALGRYIKIGKLLIATCDLRLSALTIGSGTGAVLLTGFPEQAALLNCYQGAIGAASNWANGPPIGGVVDVGTTSSRLNKSSATGIAQIPIGDLDGDEQVFGTWVYFI